MSVNFASASSEYLSVSTSRISAYGFTVCSWMKLTTGTAGTYVGPGLGNSSVGNEFFELAFLQTTRRYRTRNSSAGGSDTTNRSSNNTITQDTWHFLAAKSESANVVTVQFDSTLDTTVESTGSSMVPSNFDLTRIGAQASSGPQDYFEGDVAEVGIWNVNLTTAELAALAGGLSPALIRPGNLVNYWPLGGPYGDHYRSVWGNQDLLSASGTPTFSAHPPGIIYPHMLLPAELTAVAAADFSPLMFMPF